MSTLLLVSVPLFVLSFFVFVAVVYACGMVTQEALKEYGKADKEIMTGGVAFIFVALAIIAGLDFLALKAMV